MKYMLYGLLLDSALPLPLAEMVDTGALPDVVVRTGPVVIRGELILQPKTIHPFSCWRADGHIILQWPTVRFEVAPDSIVVNSNRPEAASHYLMQGAWSVLLTARGREALHASVVERNGQALAIMGASGNGKSTTSLAMIDQGWALLSDDVLTFNDQGLVPPGPKFMRLLRDAAAGRPGHWDALGKFRYTPPSSDACAELAWVVILSDRYEQLGRLTGLDAVDAIVTHVYNDIHTHPGQLQRRLDMALDIMARTQVYGAPPRSLDGSILERLTEMGAGVA